MKQKFMLCAMPLESTSTTNAPQGGVSKTLNNRATDADHVPCVLIMGGLAVHQNASGEVQMSEVGYTVSTNSNASGRNTPLVLVLNDQGGA